MKTLMVYDGAFITVESASAGKGGGIVWIARMGVFGRLAFSAPAPDAAEEKDDEERSAKDAAEDAARDGSLVEL